MLRSLAIKNFRCFSDFKIEKFSQVNLITGKNGVGKTAVLEALWLTTRPSDPEATLTLHAARSSDPVPTATAEEAWGWLFRNREIPAVCTQTLRTEEEAYALTFRLANPSPGILTVPGIDGAPASISSVGGSGARGLQLECYYLAGQNEFKGNYRAWIGESGPVWEISRSKASQRSAYLGTSSRVTKPDLESFSELIEEGQEAHVADLVRIVEPRIEKIVIVVAGGALSLSADVGLPRLVPLTLLGEGAVRVFKLALGFVRARNGMLFVDEIDTGLHYTALLPVWRAIRAASERFRVQVFATTHSYECVQAAPKAFAKGDGEDLRLFRLERVKGEIRAIGYDKGTLGAAVEMEAEVR